LSLQNKNQSVGYILKGMMKTDIPANKVAEAIDILWDEVVPDYTKEITNVDTLNYTVSACEKLGLDAELTSSAKTAVNWCFDDTMLIEADEFFSTFVAALRPRREYVPNIVITYPDSDK
jgi:hypothetical protein